MLPGVYAATKKDGTSYFRSNITYKNKHISLGSFSSEEEAHRAYVEAGQVLSDPSIELGHMDGFPPTLDFEKTVCLLNFRDNGIYFKNPIYLRHRFFLYFLAPGDELRFDIDDLFFYSSHKIIRRGGHLFVSDYGMQTNILSRYGIKNFAVCGKDYLFVNGDPTDFRYSNIQVINKYYGVTRIAKKNQYCYQARIHIVGTHVLGVYPTEEMAAVAYNKAVDRAKQAGIHKKYTSNYISDLTPREYAEVYTEVSLSKKFLQYLSDYKTASHRQPPDHSDNEA